MKYEPVNRFTLFLFEIKTQKGWKEKSDEMMSDEISNKILVSKNVFIN